jgi:hypothetical protein
MYIVRRMLDDLPVLQRTINEYEVDNAVANPHQESPAYDEGHRGQSYLISGKPGASSAWRRQVQVHTDPLSLAGS